MIPGPASANAAIYTALKRVQGISIWSCCPNTPTTVSLDRDLYEKSYQLKNSRENMKRQYILKLGKTYIFSHACAIGNLISGSGLEDNGLK